MVTAAPEQVVGWPILPKEIDLHFVVYATPRPQGSKIVGRYGGMREMSKGLAGWREAVRHEAQQLWNGRTPLIGPIAMLAVYSMPRPAGLSARPTKPRTTGATFTLRTGDRANQTMWWPTTQPDKSKLDRAIEDAITAAGVWQDDSQVTDSYTRKRYAGTAEPGVLAAPGVYIAIWRAT